MLLRWLVSTAAAENGDTNHNSDLYRIDPAPLQELRPLFSAERLDALVAAFVRDCTERLAHMRAAASASPPDWRELQRQAHNLGGTAGSFGLHQVGEWAQALSSAASAQDAPATSQLMAQITQGVKQGLAQLQELRTT